MNLLERRDTRLPFPELIEWLENPMFGFRPFGQIVRVEEYIADHRYVVRAELLRAWSWSSRSSSGIRFRRWLGPPAGLIWWWSARVGWAGSPPRCWAR